MSASSMPLPFLVSAPIGLSNSESRLPSRTRIDPAKYVRRRPDMQQGMALEKLGHAIEYLIDSRMFLVSEPRVPAEPDAIQILSRCSREVFATCAEVVPVQQRLKQWAAERLHVGALHPVRHRSARRI